MYNKGDYVILKDSYLWYKNYAIIVFALEHAYQFHIFFPSHDGIINSRLVDGKYYMWFNKDIILRHMTEQEKKDLNVLLDAEKFNI